MLPAMFTGFRDSMDSVRLFKLLWAVCDFDYLESQDMIDAMRDDTESFDRLATLLRDSGCMGVGMRPTVKGITTWVDLPVRFVDTIRLSNGSFLSGTVVRGAADGDHCGLVREMGCICGMLGPDGPSVDGSCNPEVVADSIWMIGYSRMRPDDVMVLFTNWDARETVDRCLYAAIEVASRME